MIVLASKSPRRISLMKRICDDFITYDADIDESSFYHLSPNLATKEIALHKALKAKEKYPGDTILAADTIVVLDDEIIHKPKDAKDAKKILRHLSSKTHQVITAYAIIKGELVIEEEVISSVTFNHLSDKLIERYVESGSPLDKAGAYGIQDNKEFPIVKSYQGSYDNIVGFPVDEIRASLTKL